MWLLNEINKWHFNDYFNDYQLYYVVRILDSLKRWSDVRFHIRNTCNVIRIGSLEDEELKERRFSLVDFIFPYSFVVPF
jgi:hypothetical protein